MKNSIASLALSLCLLAAAAAAWGARGQSNNGAGLLAAPATVNEVHAQAGMVMLWVPSAQRALNFQVSPTCLYDVNIGTLTGLKPGMHVLIWTQAGQVGTLPVIYRLALQPR